MCRMLFAVGNLNLDWLIQDMIQIALDRNEKHEKNMNREFKHDYGWGLAYLQENNLKVFRSIKPIYEDPQSGQFRQLKSNFVIMHVKKDSKNRPVFQNVHPFESRINGHHYIFTHNGTVRDEISYASHFQPLSTTDSERLFYYFLSGTNGELSGTLLRSKLVAIKDLTAANFILSDGKITYLTNWYTENPRYYTLKMLNRPDAVIIASEVLPHYGQEAWQKLKNQEIVSIRTLDLMAVKNIQNEFC